MSPQKHQQICAEIQERSQREIDRLHAANVELVAALKVAWQVICPLSPTKDSVQAGYAVYEAIEKHGGQS